MYKWKRNIVLWFLETRTDTNLRHWKGSFPMSFFYGQNRICFKFLVNNLSMRNDFFKCGVAGLCMEVLWTSITNVKPTDKRLIGNTSLWMFPIYGMAAIISPVSRFLKKKNVVVRGSIYTFFIYLMEFTTGSILKKKNCCPWDYSKSKYNIKGVIRLDYAPLWFAVGLFYEKLLSIKAAKKKYAGKG